MTTVNILRAATARLRAAKPAPPTACKGRIVLTLLFMLLTTASAWAQYPKLTVNIHYVGLTADDATVKVTYKTMKGPNEIDWTVTVTNGDEVTLRASKAVSVTVNSDHTIATAFSAKWGNYNIDVTQTGYNCSFTADDTNDTTLDITITNTGVYTVHFIPIGEATMPDQIIERNVPTRLAPHVFTPAPKYGNAFKYWEDSNGNHYADGELVTNLAEGGGEITLKAQHRTGFTVLFDANGGEGMMYNQAINETMNTALNANEFTRTGYVFAGWNTQADGLGTDYADQQTVRDLVASGYGITLYAQWVAVYTVSYDANGGEGTMADQNFIVGQSQALTANAFTRTGYSFKKWNTQADGLGTDYADGQSVTDLATTSGATVTLYALWQEYETMTQGGSINMPTSGIKYVKIPSGVTSFHVYDDGGSGGNFTDGCDGKILLQAPAGRRLRVNGTVTATNGGEIPAIYARLAVYDGSSTSADKLYQGANGTLSDVTTSDRQMLLHFCDDYTATVTAAGLDLTVTVVEETISLTANAHDGNYWTTFYCGDAGYDITTENACAYTATYSGSSLTLHKLGTTIAMGEAVIIVSATSPVSLTKGADGTKSATNDLHGVDVRTEKSTLGTGTFYVLGSTATEGFGFHPYTGTYMPARKAYLLLDGGAAQASSLTMVFEETTSLSEQLKVNSEKFATATEWYTLDGRKLSGKPTQKGLYIHNGRKEVVK